MDDFRFAICRFKTVFDPKPEPSVITLQQLTDELQRFLFKPDLARRIVRDVALVDAAWDALRSDRHHAGKAYSRLKRVRDEAEERGDDVEGALEGEYDKLRKEARKGAKETLPCWAPATFKPNSKRSSKNVLELSCVVLDYDDGTSPDDASAIWEQYFHIVHTSWSHTPEKPRFRLVLPLSRPCPVAFWSRLWLWAEQHCGHEIDPACKGASRMWTLPAVPSDESPHLAFSHGSPLLDPLGGEVERFHVPFTARREQTHRLLHSQRSLPTAWEDTADEDVEAAPTADPVEEPSSRLVEDLERLAKLHRDGDLDDAEFKLAKARLLSGS